MAISGNKCEEVVLGNVAAVFVVKGSPPARPKALQRGGDHPTSIPDVVVKRLTV
jgi:hypothetical protein